MRPTEASGQPACFLADGLDVPIGMGCQPATLVLPQFPDIEVGSKYICWSRCSPQLQAPVRLAVEPVERACGYYLTRFRMTNQTGRFELWSGRLIMTYSRTWAEADPSGGGAPNIQVWRFLINGDLEPSQRLVALFGLDPCVVPPCFFTFGKFHVAGFIDFAFYCDQKTWSITTSFNHECDLFEHANALTSRPGAFHQQLSYTWVAAQRRVRL